MDSINEETVKDLKIISELSGKTLLIYWTLLKKGKALGVRELQRLLNFSSPSVASYHLEKLNDLGLVEKDEKGAYFIKKKANIAELKELYILRLTNRIILIPRYVFYAVFISVLVMGYVLFFFDRLITTEGIFVLIIGLFSALAFWFETYRVYKDKPI